jgi:hypothetical protein
MFVVTRSVGSSLSRFSRCRNGSAFFLSSKSFSSHPKPPLDLDPSLQALLKDVDVSLSHSASRTPLSPPQRELEAFPIDDIEGSALTPDEEIPDRPPQRKSPAALFGSDQIGAIVLPPQLQTSINLLISGAGYPSYSATKTCNLLCPENPTEYSCIATLGGSFMARI